MVDGRLFVDSTTMISISEGPCIMISEELCSITTGYMHINMIHSNTIVCISFWYRSVLRFISCSIRCDYRLRMLTEKSAVGRLRLQVAILLLFVPHMIHIACAMYTASPRELLVPTISRYYEYNRSDTCGLFGEYWLLAVSLVFLSGFSDISELGPLLVMAYLVLIPVFINTYIVRARNKVHSTSYIVIIWYTAPCVVPR